MNILIKLILSGSVFSSVVITGCSNIPEKSPMSQVKSGMTRGEVIDILDAPNDVSQEKTWRADLIPWKTDNDYRTVYSYEGQGSIEFDRGGSKVVQNINYSGVKEEEK